MSESFVATPASNTGVEMPPTPLDLRSTIHWIQGTGSLSLPGSEPFALLESFLDFVFGHFLDDYVLQPGKGYNPGRYFEHSGYSLAGGRFAWNDDKSGRIDFWLSLPGSLLDRIPLQAKFPQSDLVGLIAGLSNPDSKYIKFKCTRIDVALDDYSLSFPVQSMAELIRCCDSDGKLQHIARVHQARIYESFGEDNKGITAYLGSAKSESFLRYYDKSLESGGKENCNRFELQSRGYKAASLFSQLGEIIHSVHYSDERFYHHLNDCPVLPRDLDFTVPQFLASHVVGFCDFVVSREAHLERCVRFDWWQRIIDSVGSINRISSKKVVHSILKSCDWILSQVAPTLSVLQDVFGIPEFQSKIVSWLADGKSRYDSKHEKLISNGKEYLRSIGYRTTTDIATFILA